MRHYNDHNLESFLETYSPDISIYTYPDTLLGEGIDHLRALFSPLFDAGDVRVEINQQITRDRYVVSDENVWYGEQPPATSRSTKSCPA